MRSCGGSWMRRRCRICSAARPAAALLEAAAGDCSVVFVALAGGDVRVIAAAGCDDGRRAHAGALGRERQRLRARHDRRRAARARSRRSALRPGRVAAADRPSGDAAAADDRRGRAAGVRAVRRARSIAGAVADLAVDRSLEPLLPGFLSASAAMTRVVEQIQRLQGNDLTVLITGRERHRQGARGARDSRRIASERRDVPALQLHDDRPRSGRQPAVRPSARQLHRRRVGSAGPRAHGRRRHAVPRRDRRSAARRAAQAAAVPRAAGDHADRRDAAAARRRARAGGDQRRPRAARGRRQVPRGLCTTG